jgi:hypothetical protein
MTPNLIERMENLIAALDQVCDEIELGGSPIQTHEQNALARLSDAEGIAGEVLTMIDGR